MGALAQNIEIYGTWGLTLTPFWRAEATIHAYLRWISAWAKIRYGMIPEEPRPPSPLPGPLPRSRINSLPSYKPFGETLSLPITNVQLETKVSIASRNPLRSNLYEQEREASYRRSVCFRVGWKRELGESQSRREDKRNEEEKPKRDPIPSYTRAWGNDSKRA